MLARECTYGGQRHAWTQHTPLDCSDHRCDGLVDKRFGMTPVANRFKVTHAASITVQLILYQQYS
jgi:hypothetical protein